MIGRDPQRRLLGRLPERLRARMRRLVDGAIQEGHARTPAAVVAHVEARNLADLEAALAEAEQAVDGPYTTQASLALDRALVAVEAAREARAMPLHCLRCGRPEPVRVRWRARPGMGHLGAWCARCGAWVKWLPHRYADAVTSEPAPDPAADQAARPFPEAGRP